MFDIVEYLQSKNIQLKQAGVDNVHCACWYCNEDSAARGRLYINVDPNADPIGLFKCFRCDESGAINKIRKHFGDKPLQQEEQDEKDLRTYAVIHAAAEFYHEGLLDEDNLTPLKYWTETRGFTPDTIANFKLGYGVDGLHVHLKEHGFTEEQILASGLVDKNGREFLQGTMTIPYLIAGKAYHLRGRTLGNSQQKYLTPTGLKGRLFNAEVTFTDIKEVVVCEAELDAVALMQNGIPAVGMSGATAFQQAWVSYFDGLDRVYVVFDRDIAGEKGEAKVAEMIGPKTRIVHLPDSEEKLDCNQWFLDGRTAEEFRELLGKVKHPLLISIDEAFEQWGEMQSMDGIMFGIDALDLRIQGAHPSQLLVYLAKAGVGKTLFMLNLFYRMSLANQDLKILFVSLEQTRTEWFERARRIHRFYNPDHSDARALDFFRGRLALVDKNRITEEQLVSVIEAYKDNYGRLDVVAIDYLGYWAWAYQGEEYQRTSAAVMALKGIAKETNTFIIAPHQVNRGGKYGEELEADDARGSGVVSESSDFMFTLWSEDNRKGIKPDAKTGRVTCKIVKSRHGGTGTEVQLQFAPLTLAMVPVSDAQNAMRARDELSWEQCKDDVATALFRHGTGDDRMVIPEQDLLVWRQSLI
jgi:hypothetical protein